ncbi:MAG: PilN domain-containing protein [Pyrinomonadaceae bacterium]|nr:PilN domain-containing protein [Pyrinomonadaceae bacterium]MCX7639968.1 PilN domain-containing protein [Pyrinomonadaceae bacterium]MDW8304140.1 PilN domain-containing protein [Acidobacteriota bacterium]
MIKINLLESVTERQSSPVIAVEKKVASPASRLIVMSIVVAALTVLFIGWDIISTQMAKAEAERQLEEQRKIAAQLEAIIKEQKELEEKIKNIDTRVEAIKRLRSTQAGPSAVLEAIRERFAMLPQLYLESIEQKGDVVTIKGYSPNENMVTQFGRSLEFSSGLFTNLNIETQRKENQAVQTAAENQSAAKIDIVEFTIRTNYNPSKKPSDQQTQQASVSQPGQIARN